MQDFGLLLKTLRTKANLTQKALAEILCTTPGTVSKWETGSNFPDIAMLPGIAAALHVSCDELLNPTETLRKLNGELLESPSSQEMQADEPALDQINPFTAGAISKKESAADSTKKHSFKLSYFTPKRLLFLCIPILLLVTILVISGRKQSLLDQERPIYYEFAEERKQVDTPYGKALEQIYYVYYYLSDEELWNYANSFASSWRFGTKTSKEDIFVVSFYPLGGDIDNWDEAEFRAFYFRPDSQ